MSLIMTVGGILLLVIGAFAIKIHIDKKHESICDDGCYGCCDCEEEEDEE